LMRCYCRQGQRHLALRQYHLCTEVLTRELGVPPTQETTTLYDHIRNEGVV
jgi:DNA-binding SARP family transcriptional activator